MIRGLYTSATGMLVENMRTDVIANNLANVNTTGYKKDIGIFRALPEKMIRRAGDNAIPTLPVAKTVKRIIPEREMRPLPFRKPKIIGKMGTGAILDEVWVDHEEGILMETERPLDAASVKKAFFVVEDPKGGVHLTKNGSFNINQEGYLVTQSGEYILGVPRDDNNPDSELSEEFMNDKGELQVTLKRIYAGRMGDFRMDNNGNIFPGDAGSTQKIYRAWVDDPRKIEKKGNNFYKHKMGVLKSGMQHPIQMGYLEKANFSVVSEMVELITASRAYESNSKVIQTHDSLLDRSVNSLGRVG